jgi:mycothiol synthase
VWRAVTQRPDGCLLLLDEAASVAALTMPSDSFTPAYRQLAVAATPGVGDDTIAPIVDAVLVADAGTEITAWLPGSDAAIEAALTTLGFRTDRRQHQMRVPLPRPDAIRIPAEVEVRAFRPGTDDAAWLRVNNRAFENHPDQGGWVEEILARRMAEPWFDPAGFLLAWRDDVLAGFCWTKVHTEPEHLGEIFVIGVDPDAQGIGLGRALTLAGLDHLAVARGCPTGVLYVAAENAPAVGLYTSIGFEVHRTDTALVLDRDRT